MRGHEALVAMRRRGMRPVSADISDGMDRLGCWRDWQHWTGVAHVEVQPGDSINRLDLRCMVGLIVSVAGTDPVRVRALHDACVAAGARAVMAAVYAPTASGDLRRVDGIETLPTLQELA